jgi:hypothetical protein
MEPRLSGAVRLVSLAILKLGLLYAKKIFQVVTTSACVTIDARMLRARRKASP